MSWYAPVAACLSQQPDLQCPAPTSTASTAAPQRNALMVSGSTRVGRANNMVALTRFSIVLTE
eukprot:CAMPEP_0117681076 /NCGR_PEP_ID=MMETSP0804-20121206/18751_1 /TAXON_ID=1074897 /ORGANISM="Tetraselmis astigmatica, Strain CCMP880" /LENGTH=62 /DNA_ID=CAMNT_0005490733 /DNA_START=1197 /DNA_END=1382 /DNA_ORIENTATION=+